MQTSLPDMPSTLKCQCLVCLLGVAIDAGIIFLLILSQSHGRMELIQYLEWE